MEKTYNPATIETKWYETWEAKGYFSSVGGDQTKSPYCIVIPPPNVTGSLHMGHAFQDTIMDGLTRYHRMLGEPTLWQPGTDHAGIATQMVVERQLAMEGKTRHDLGRDAFIDRVWQWKEESGGTITKQLRRMGASPDWSRERFTMDDGLSEAVKEVFVRLHEEGLIYRGKRLVNWDPVLHTAVSDLEVLSEEENGHLWHMCYPLADGSGHVVVATTRPETLLGDAAVAVHPDDERYQHLIGQKVNLPTTGRQIPIIADTYVDPEFGSGCVKITPAHDFNDYQVWQRHRDHDDIKVLPHGGLINIFNFDAAIVSADSETGDMIPTGYHGLDRYDARKKIVAELETGGLLEKIDDHKLMVPRGDRTNAVIEPYLTDQWFVKAAPLAEPAIAAVEDGSIRFVPDNWKNTYFEWMRNIEDWCISRQIWWGHRIPAWYDEAGNIYVGRSEAEVRETHTLPDNLTLTQDNDVLDTWFSSALWPFSTLGWPEQTHELKTFYPTSVLVTGFDIIFFWVARMIMMGLKFTGKVPFREIYIHGLVRDAEGQKMSKSKGNVLDPIDLIDGIELDALIAKRTKGLMQPKMAAKITKQTRNHFPDGIPAFGTDALRFTFAALASTGRDIRFDLNRIEGNRNFCNKLWNAARYVLMNTEGKDGLTLATPDFSLADQWIQSQLQKTITLVRENFDQYRFDLAASALYDFIWHHYCDWYLELSKTILQNDLQSIETKAGTRQTLVTILEQLLCMLHPLMPFITEEIWQRVAPLARIEGDTISQRAYPQADPKRDNPDAEATMQWVMEFILGLRQIRGEMDISPGKPLPVLLQNASTADQQRLSDNQVYLDTLARLESITYLRGSDEAPECATALLGSMKILVPMAGLIDKDAELQRLTKRINKIETDLTKSLTKLNNPSFVERAPAAVVQTEQARVSEMQTAIADLSSQRQRIENLG